MGALNRMGRYCMATVSGSAGRFSFEAGYDIAGGDRCAWTANIFRDGKSCGFEHGVLNIEHHPHFNLETEVARHVRITIALSNNLGKYAED